MDNNKLNSSSRKQKEPFEKSTDLKIVRQRLVDQGLFRNKHTNLIRTNTSTTSIIKNNKINRQVDDKLEAVQSSLQALSLNHTNTSNNDSTNSIDTKTQDINMTPSSGIEYHERVNAYTSYLYEHDKTAKFRRKPITLLSLEQSSQLEKTKVAEYALYITNHFTQSNNDKNTNKDKVTNSINKNDKKLELELETSASYYASYDAQNNSQEGKEHLFSHYRGDNEETEDSHEEDSSYDENAEAEAAAAAEAEAEEAAAAEAEETAAAEAEEQEEEEQEQEEEEGEEQDPSYSDSLGPFLR